ncbi:hypothetical protein BH09BAC4_BH09BAC4_04130 [soil metagenome]
MAKIDQIHKDVFDFLLEKHYREKEAGKDFFFKIYLNDHRLIRSIFELENKLADKEFIAISFWEELRSTPYLFLVINDIGTAYLVFDFDGFEPEVDALIYDLFLTTFRNQQYIGETFLGYSPIRIHVCKPFKGQYMNYLNEFLTTKYEVDERIMQAQKESQQMPKSFLHNFVRFIDVKSFDIYLKSSPFYREIERAKKQKITLRDLSIINYKGIYNETLKDFSSRTRWIFVTGENGYGKTSLLQAIAAGFYGIKDTQGTELISSTSRIVLNYHADGREFAMDSQDQREKVFTSRLADELATYGSSRLSITADVSQEDLVKQSPPTYSLFNTESRLWSIEQRLKDTEKRDNEAFRQIVGLLKKLLPNLGNIEINPNTYQVEYFEKDEEGRMMPNPVSFNQLAAGYRNVIAMIGDMIYRLSSGQQVKQLSELQGIVIIDEIELHLHPRYQKLLVEVLTHEFPDIQFIASTHSPIPLLGAPPETEIIHVTRSEREGIKAEHLDIDFSVLTPNAILTSPIFGFQDIIPDSKSDKKMVRTEDTYQEVQFNDKLKQNVSQFLSQENQEEFLKILGENPQ